jgi:hypothetical protein
MEIATAITTVDISYSNGVNSIEPSLAQNAAPLHLFDCLCSKLKSVSCALACCIGTTTTAAESIATAARTATITNVELSILSSLNIYWYMYFKRNNSELYSRHIYYSIIINLALNK